jgi:hypothetical protein
VSSLAERPCARALFRLICIGLLDVWSISYFSDGMRRIFLFVVGIEAAIRLAQGSISFT